MKIETINVYRADLRRAQTRIADEAKFRSQAAVSCHNMTLAGRARMRAEEACYDLVRHSIATKEGDPIEQRGYMDAPDGFALLTCDTLARLIDMARNGGAQDERDMRLVRTAEDAIVKSVKS